MRLILCLIVTLCWNHGFALSAPMDNAPEMAAAERTWNGQSHDVVVPKHGGAYVGGVYLWRGRADREYKPFHQWEIKLKAGANGASAVKCKVIPLDTEMNVQQLFRKKGTEWKEVGKIDANGEKLISYKLNCSNITAYRMELEWEGGKQALFAGTPTMLPIDAKALDKQPYITVSDADFKYKKSRRRATVTFYLANVGGAAAEGVEHTIEFLGADGKPVHTVTYVPEKGTVEKGYGKMQKAEFKKVPKFDNINIRTKQVHVLTYELDGDQLVAKEDVGLSGLKVSDTAITGTITNGFKEDLENLTVTVSFEDDMGKVVRKVDIKIAALKAGASTPFEEKIDKSFAYKAYSMGYSFGSTVPIE